MTGKSPANKGNLTQLTKDWRLFTIFQEEWFGSLIIRERTKHENFNTHLLFFYVFIRVQWINEKREDMHRDFLSFLL